MTHEQVLNHIENTSACSKAETNYLIAQRIAAASQAELAEKNRQIGKLVEALEALEVIKTSTVCPYSHIVATKALNDFAKCGGKITEVPYSVEDNDE